MSSPIQRPDVNLWLAERDPIPTIAWGEQAAEDTHHPASAYVETYWLPFLGPSATLALRRIAAGLAEAPASGMWLPIHPFASSLGLKPDGSRHCTARKAIARLVRFGLANVDDDVLAVRMAVPTLSERNVDRLPPHLAHQHRTDFPGRAPSRTTAPQGALT